MGPSPALCFFLVREAVSIGYTGHSRKENTYPFHANFKKKCYWANFTYLQCHVTLYELKIQKPLQCTFTNRHLLKIEKPTDTAVHYHAAFWTRSTMFRHAWGGKSYKILHYPKAPVHLSPWRFFAPANERVWRESGSCQSVSYHVSTESHNMSLLMVLKTEWDLRGFSSLNRRKVRTRSEDVYVLMN